MKKAIILPIILLLGVFGIFISTPTVPVSGASVTHYYEDFESGLSSLWTATGDWHIEDNATSNYPITDPSVTIPSGTHYMWYGDNTSGTYNNVSGYLTWGPLDLTTIPGKIEVNFFGWLYHWNEYLDVRYSPDGGAWYYPFSGWFAAHTVRFSQLSFEVPHYARTSTFYFQFRFLQNTMYGESEFGWRIDDVAITETPDYSIEFEQLGVKNALVDETRSLGYSIKLLYSESQMTQIMVNITSPSSMREMIVLEDVTLSSGEKWYYSHEYTFTEEGIYNITVYAVDELGTLFAESKIWEIGPYLVMHRTDSGYFVNIGETPTMEFMIISFYDVDTIFDINIWVESAIGGNHTIYQTQTEITTFEEFRFSASETFLEKGSHRVFMNAVDPMGKNYTRFEGYWEVGPYYFSWVENIEPYEERYVGESIPLNVFVEARTATSGEIDIQVEIIDPDYFVERVYEESALAFPPEEIWNQTVSYTCTKAGLYQLDVLMVNSSDPSEFWWSDRVSWFTIEELSLTITQEGHYATLNEEETMEFILENHYGYEKEVDILISVETPSNNEVVLHEETVTLQTGEMWSLTLEYTFEETGRYVVEFQVVDDTGKEWLEDSWWSIPSDNTTTDTTLSLDSPGFGLVLPLLSVLVILVGSRLFRKKR